MITILFSGCKVMVFNILPKGSKLNQLYFVNYIFPDLNQENVNFHVGPHKQATFGVHTDNSIDHNGFKVSPKFENHHVSRLPHPTYSPDRSSCDLWFLGMLKGVLKDREFNSSNEIEKGIMKVWDELTFDEVQTISHNWISLFTWVVENGGEYITEQIRNGFLA
jgi:hypothetical protein